MSFDEQSLITLAKMGICNSEAKIYLTIIRLGRAKAIDIAKKSQSDRASTYRLITKLQEGGLVQKWPGMPAEFTAIPLENLISLLLQRRMKEFSDLREEAKEILKKNTKIGAEVSHNDYLYFSTISETVVHTVIPLLDSCESSIKILTSYIRCRQSSEVMKKSLQKAMKRGVSIQYLMEKPCETRMLPKPLKSLSTNSKFEIRYLPCSYKGVQTSVLDEKQASIVLSENQDYFKSSILCTSNPQLVKLANYYFESLWRDSKQ
jgi:sugar-specific transcriptional regulator TrmB